MSYYQNHDNIFDRAKQTIDLIGKSNFIRNLLPNGKLEGHEYVAINPTRIDKHLGSFRINTISTKWSDFATGDKGRDLISLYAYLKAISNYEAACAIVGVQLSKNKRG
jgi:hypothetical protein